MWQKKGQGNRSAEIVSTCYHDELSDCQVCQSGKYNEKGGSICQVCPIGKYRSHPNDGKSVSTLVNGQNAESCSSCAVGTLDATDLQSSFLRANQKQILQVTQNNFEVRCLTTAVLCFAVPMYFATDFKLTIALKRRSVKGNVMSSFPTMPPISL